jgi:hypothetical protein
VDWTIIDFPTPVIPVKNTGFSFNTYYLRSHENLTVSLVGTTNSKKLLSLSYTNCSKF